MTGATAAMAIFKVAGVEGLSPSRLNINRKAPEMKLSPPRKRQTPKKSALSLTRTPGDPEPFNSPMIKYGGAI